MLQEINNIMAKITYKLYDPKTKQDIVFKNGNTSLTIDGDKAEIDAYAKKKGFDVSYVEDPLEKAAGAVSPVEAAAGGLLSGLSLNFRDEIFKKDEAGIYPQEAEKLAYPRIYEGSKLVGSTATNILADLGLMAAFRGRLSPTALAAVGGAGTGAIESLGETPEDASTTDQALAAAIGAGGGATGGVIGAKVLGPLLKAGGRFVKSKLPKLGIPGYAGEAADETVEGSIEKLNAEAQKAAIERLQKEKALEKFSNKRANVGKSIDELRKIQDAAAEATSEAGARTFELRAVRAGEMDPSEIAEFPEVSPKVHKEIMDKSPDKLTPDELFLRIERLYGSYLNDTNEIRKLEEAIAKSNMSDAARKVSYDNLRNKLMKADSLKDYIERFPSSYLGGAIGAQAGTAGSKYATSPSGVRKGSI
jgi:hypothetical protein